MEENLVPLCGDGTRGCHGLVENRDAGASLKLGSSLTRVEVAYVLQRKNPVFLERYFGLTSARL